MAKRRSNQEGTLYQRKDGRWCAQVSLNGRRLTHDAGYVSVSFPGALPQSRGRADVKKGAPLGWRGAQGRVGMQ